MSRVIGALVATLCLGSAATAAENDSAALAQRLEAGLRHIRDGHCDGADWTAIAQDAAFPKLSSAERAATYINLGACIGGSRQHEWRVLASKEPDAPPLAWGLLFLEAVDRRDTQEALSDLEADRRAAAHTGEAFDVVNDDGVYFLHNRLKDDPASKRRLLAVLDESGWTPADPAADPSYFWREYAGMLLRDHRASDAKRVSAKVTHPRQLLLMRLDNDFEPLTSADPGNFDVAYAAYATLERDRKTATTAANDMGAYQVIDDLRLLGRLDDALTVADATLAKAKIIDDHGQDYRNWIEDRRAYVLFDMGQFAEAIATEEAAAKLTERGGLNVSNAINLAGMLNGVGQHAEALAVLPPLDGPLSGYGAMWVAAERACAANALSNAPETDKALAFTAAHAGDNRNARVKALLCVGDVAAARQIYLEWLQDRDDHAEALLQLCHFASGKRAPFDATISERFDKIRSDPAVLAEVAKVGHTENLPLRGLIWIDFQ